MEIEIEKLSYQDIETFCKVFYSVLEKEFPGYDHKIINYFKNYAYTPGHFRYWISEEQKTILIARKNGQIAGFAVIDGQYGGVSLCRWLGILPQYQKQGIGKQLMYMWEKIANAQSCHKLELAAQESAKGFYEKAGLKLEGKRELSYFGVSQFIFGKVIAKPNIKSMV